MENNQKHLDPDTVLWFNKRGFEFGKTACVWAEEVGHPEWDEAGNPYYIGDREHKLYIANNIENNEDIFDTTIFPAPNFQEVLEVLPKYIEYIGGTLSVKFLPPYAHNKERTVFRYVDISNITLVYFGDENPLIAATDLLKWVVENHPKSLTKKY